MSNQDIETPETEPTPDNENNAQCDTNVNIRINGSKGAWGNNRGVHSFRCDDGLYLAFKERTEVMGSSVCSVIESFQVAYLGATNPIVEGKVNIGNTFNMEQTVYRQLGRDRRRANPKFSMVDEESIREDEREKLRIKAIREEVRGEKRVKPEPGVDVGALVDELAEGVFDLYSERGLSGIGVIYDLLREVAVPIDLQSQVRERVIDFVVDGERR